MLFDAKISKGLVTITFPTKPAEPIRRALKSAGFWWNAQAQHWFRRRVDGAADFLTYLERLLSPGKPDGACWSCGDPNGFFRPEGAATPVYCDECHKAHRTYRYQKDGTGRTHNEDPTDTLYEQECKDRCGL